MDVLPDSVDMKLGKLQEIVRDKKAWSPAVHGVMKCQTELGNWKTRFKNLKDILLSKITKGCILCDSFYIKVHIK